MDELIAGYFRFRENGWPQARRIFESLAEHGQKPRALVVGCVDSRVDPGVIFDTAPGQLLTIRNVANLVPPYAPDAEYHGTSAALEFGVRVLEIPHVIVLGHGQCGGVQALLQGESGEATDFVPHWMGIAAQARQVALRCDSVAMQQEVCEHECIKVSLANLLTFPWIADRVASGKLKLHGAWYAIRTGQLLLLDAQGRFTPPG